jgi:hypothetical protein
MDFDVSAAEFKGVIVSPKVKKIMVVILPHESG